MKPLRTWIVVVDGGHAKFLHLLGRKSGARTISGHVYAKPARRTHELGRDRPARVMQSKSATRHAVQPRIDLHNQEELLFLEGVVRNLEIAFEANAFDDLVILAPPKALGLLRKMIPQRIQDHIAGEVDGDYTSYNDEEIAKVVFHLLDEQSRKSA